MKDFNQNSRPWDCLKCISDNYDLIINQYNTLYQNIIEMAW